MEENRIYQLTDGHMFFFIRKITDKGFYYHIVDPDHPDYIVLASFNAYPSPEYTLPVIDMTHLFIENMSYNIIREKISEMDFY